MNTNHQLPNNPSKKLISKNLILTVSVNIIGKLSNFFVTIILARIFAPEIIGMIGFANAISGIAFLTLKFGLENYILREISQNPEKAIHFYHRTFSLNIYSISISSLLFVIIAFILSGPSVEFKIQVVIFMSIIIGVITELSIAYYKAFFQVIYEVYIRIINRGSLLLFVLPLLYFTRDLDSYLFSVLLLAIISSIVSLQILRTKFNFTHVFKSFKESFAVVGLSYKFALLSIVVFIVVQLDMILIKIILGNESAGYYKIASIFYFPFTIIPGSMMGVILPLLSKYKDVPSKFESIQNRVYRFLAFLAVLIVYTVSFFASPFIEYFFAGKYNSSIPVLMVLIWALIPYYLDMISGYVFIANGFEKEPLKINATALVIGFTGSTILIHLFGLIGAAISIIITSSSKWIFGLIRLKYYKKIYKKNRNIFLFLLLSLVNFLVYQQADMDIVVKYFLVMFSLLLITKFTGLINKNDVYQIKNIFKKNIGR